GVNWSQCPSGKRCLSSGLGNSRIDCNPRIAEADATSSVTSLRDIQSSNCVSEVSSDEEAKLTTLSVLLADRALRHAIVRAKFLFTEAVEGPHNMRGPSTVQRWEANVSS